jgi:FkbM family methyltransferase
MRMIKKILKDLVPPIFFKIGLALFRKIRIGGDGKYVIGDYSIRLPPNHTLKRFQNAHKLYDRFLPVLARYIRAGEIIVDVGANVGDTAIMMLNETKAEIVCVEPSDLFYGYLEENINNLPKGQRNKLRSIKSMVGTQEVQGKLVHNLGTAKLKEVNDNQAGDRRDTLDNLLGDGSNIALIKVDTDGFDFDVIRSAEKIIEKHRPILFWENQIETQSQRQGYEAMYDFLVSMNYHHLYIFDNFGNVMIKDTSYEVLKDINDYVYNTQNYQGTKTIYYTDVLAGTAEKRTLMQRAIDAYEREWTTIP